ncbi:hypothetical protein [Mesorhizobium sp. M1142]
MAEVAYYSFQTRLPSRAVPIYAQSGNAREINADKMILQALDLLSHGLIH